MKGSTPMPLLYIHAVVNRREIDVMVDTSVTLNFVSKVVVAWLKLNIGKHTSHVKTINSKAQPVADVVHGATIGLGGWEEKIDLLTVPIDNFDLILGINFLVTAKAAVMPYLG